MNRLTYRDGHNKAFYKSCQNCKYPANAAASGCAGVTCVGCFQEINHCAKLADYEDAEEDGSLVRLPLKIGDPLFAVDEFTGKIGQYTVKGYRIASRCMYFEVGNGMIFRTAYLGEKFFRTREEAERKVSK